MSTRIFPGFIPRSYHEHTFSTRMLACVILAHIIALAWISSAQPHSAPTEPAVLSVQIIAPSAAIAPAPPPPQHKPKPAPAPVRQAAPVAPQRPTAAPSAEPTPSNSDMAPPQDAPAQPAAPSTSNTSGNPLSKALDSAPATLVQARFDAAYLQNPPPVYPNHARRLGEQGRVVLRVLVESNGLPSRIEVKSSSGYARLDQSAQDAVLRWKFIPARRGEETVAAWVLVPFEFNLRG